MRYSLFTGFCSVCFVAFISTGTSFAQEQDMARKQMDAAQQMIQPAPRPLPIARDGEIIDSVGGGATEAVLPIVETENGATYITGGIGDEEMDEMKAQEPNFNVRVLIVASSGEYMGENAIRFINQQNAEVLRVKDVGPFFYTNLPAGHYLVEVASPSGMIKSAKIVVKEKATASGKTVIRFNE